MARLAGTRAPAPAPKIPGLYLFGAVGRGKSMLMDLFHASLPEGTSRRLHFHEMMREAHAQLHRWRTQTPASARTDSGDPIPRLAHALSENRRVLCLDEMDIQDIGDAMIVGRLFQAITDLGVVVVVTSNREPDDLYRHGLQREKFLPFIALIKERMEVVELASARDYRLDRMKGMTVYITPPGPAADDWLTRCMTRLANGETPAPRILSVDERPVRVRAAAGPIARFTFADLCAAPLGSHDYLAIAETFDVVLISDIPCLGPHNRDEARRFVVLIDALYDHRTALICSAAAPPHELYPSGDGAFEFERTVSRLMEMQAESYLGQAHLGPA
ncbi:cell division protein ZapE [Pararhodospirillum oryzae]|uniref:Cell division protein ZapE n=2 Tax=Pararhodospirillum oryzae TaxID=478448 RepID=A0A512HB64_9PROT|nr:cell division protein ZapE [Pararhodospirillum oryzae]